MERVDAQSPVATTLARTGTWLRHVWALPALAETKWGKGSWPVDRRVSRMHAERSPEPRALVINGTVGVGKTSVAEAWAIFSPAPAHPMPSSTSTG